MYSQSKCWLNKKTMIDHVNIPYKRGSPTYHPHSFYLLLIPRWAGTAMLLGCYVHTTLSYWLHRMGDLEMDGTISINESHASLIQNSGYWAERIYIQPWMMIIWPSTLFQSASLGRERDEESAKRATYLQHSSGGLGKPRPQRIFLILIAVLFPPKPSQRLSKVQHIGNVDQHVVSMTLKPRGCSIWTQFRSLGCTKAALK